MALNFVMHQRQLFPTEAFYALPRDHHVQKRRSPSRKTADRDPSRKPGWESNMQVVDASVKRYVNRLQKSGLSFYMVLTVLNVDWKHVVSC